MMTPPEGQTVEMVPVERITVINPRARNKQNFKEIVRNIQELGLKRPIANHRRPSDLVCHFHFPVGNGTGLKRAGTNQRGQATNGTASNRGGDLREDLALSIPLLERLTNEERDNVPRRRAVRCTEQSHRPVRSLGECWLRRATTTLS
jgi:hypothetical protein